MLMGEFQHNLDAKGRLFMPVKLREALGTKFVLTKGLDGCLFVYDLEQWRLLEAKLNSLPMTRKGARDFNRFFFYKRLSAANTNWKLRRTYTPFRQLCQCLFHYPIF
jgi:division/cell wall cluster transcriptional repressor MraZ